ncbi:glycosyltransferase family 4 protein [Halobacteriota archaeon]
MKICIVVPFFTPFVRGNEYGLAQSLTKLGHDVTIVTSTAKAPREVMIRGKDCNFYSYDFKVKYFTTPLNLGENPMVPSVFTHILKNDYDVVLLQEDYPFICHLAYFAARLKRTPTILSTERTYYPTDLKKRILLKTFDKTVNKIVRDGVDVITAHCNSAKEFMIKELGVKREIKVINVGVDTKLFRPMEGKGQLSTSCKLKILTVARLHRYKGLNYLIEAMQLLQESSEAKLYILGRGAEERNLKNLVKRLGLEGEVEFLEKPIPNYEMPFLYSECDIYVQPSIIEPYGIVVLEAMACEKPVIGTKVGGMLDTIKNGETGYLVEPGNVKEMADRIMILMNRDKKTEMGKKAREWVIDNFDWMVIGKRYQEVIEDLL